MSDPWISTLTKKIYELELIASWASQVGYGTVRDHCRVAAYDILQSIKQRQDSLARAKENVE